jgi:hypothetical protein
MRIRYFTAAIVLLFAACKKTEIPGQPLEQGDKSIPVFSGGITTVENIYVSGYIENNNNQQQATYWKNSVPFPIGTPAPLCEARSIVVYGNDIYTGGSQILSGSGTTPFHRLWKNGVPQSMGNAQGCLINAIAVSGSTTYAVGFNNLLGTPHYLRYWVNGVADFFVAGGSGASDITLSGSDIYIAGYTESAGRSTAAVWKNKQLLPIETGDAIRNSANAINITGTDVHVAGVQNTSNTTSSQAVYWKNGVRTLLPVITVGSNYYASASDLVVAGANVYITGTNSPVGANSKVMLWRNGTPIEITNGSVSSGGTAIALSANGYLYITGNERSGGITRARLWKYDLTSGLVTSIPLQEAEQGSSAYDIFIKPVKIIVDPPPGDEVE